jgi:methionyl-tRNA formyltransferase
MRIVLFGDAQWAANTLRRLLAAGHDVLMVVERTRPTDSALASAAREHGITLVNPADVNDPDFVAQIRTLAPELNLSVSFDQILRADILSSAPLGFVNLHAGSLPFYRGRNVVNWALLNGETAIGLTAHFIDTGVDTGDIITQWSLPIAWTDTYADILDKLFAAVPDLTLRVVADLAEGSAVRRPQSTMPGTYFPARRAGDEWLDWSDSSRNIYNKIRAISRPGPGALTMLGTSLLKVWRAELDLSWPAYIATPGEVVGRRTNGVFVKTGDSTVLLTEVEIEGGQPVVPRWKTGTRLGVNLSEAVIALQQRLNRVEQMLSRATSEGS